MTKTILHMSDTHGLHWESDFTNPGLMPSADILVHTGDFTDAGAEAEIVDFNRWLGAVKQRHPRMKILVICGNHEWKAVGKATTHREIPAYIKNGSFLRGGFLSPEYLKRTLHNADEVLEHRAVEVDGIRFFGSSWCPWHPKEDLDSYRLSEHCPGLDEARKQWLRFSHRSDRFDRFDEIPEKVDVLLTHGPPKGILDRMEGGQSPYGSSLALRQAIEQKQPKVHLFGHCHEQRGFWIKQHHGSFQGGVEYQPAQGVRFFRDWRGPPDQYPCQLIACTALKNHNRLDFQDNCLVAPPRLIVAENKAGAWSFSLPQASSGYQHPSTALPLERIISAAPSHRGMSPAGQVHNSMDKTPKSYVGGGIQEQRAQDVEEDAQHKLLNAAKSLRWGEVKKQITENPAIVKAQPGGHDTVLHHAARGYNIDIVEFLIRKNHPLLAVNSDGKTPWEVARYDRIKEVLASAGGASAAGSPANAGLAGGVQSGHGAHAGIKRDRVASPAGIRPAYNPAIPAAGAASFVYPAGQRIRGP